MSTSHHALPVPCSPLFVPSLLVVAVVHGALIWWLVTALTKPQEVTPPVVMVSQLVSQPPAPTKAAPSKPAPQPPAPAAVKPTAQQPSPLAPLALPKAPASAREPTPPPVPTETQPKVEPSNTPPAPAEPTPAAAPPQKPGTGPVVPPRSDAAHLNNPLPIYPSSSKRLGEYGEVFFDVHILANGTVGQIKLKRSSGFARLDNAAKEAILKWRYVPAKRGDEPIDYWYVQPIDFAKP